MAIITVGGPAIDRPSTTTVGRTSLDLLNAIPTNGVIHTFNVYLTADSTNCYVGIFYLVSETTYMCRSSANVGNRNAGLQEITGLSLVCEAGDYIGYYSQTGSLDRNDTGGRGASSSGNACNQGSSYNFYTGERIYSLNAIGNTLSAITKMNGVNWEAISKINNLPKNNLNKINGILI